MTIMLFSEITHFIKIIWSHLRCFTLLFVLIHLLIAIMMVSDFGDTNFTFKIDLAFNFEMNDKVQIDAKENGKILKKINTTPDDLT